MMTIIIDLMWNSMVSRGFIWREIIHEFIMVSIVLDDSYNKQTEIKKKNQRGPKTPHPL
jgi:hypothetical protein